MPCECGYPDGMSPLGRMVFPQAPPSGKPSSLWETFHQDTHTGMAYLYNTSCEDRKPWLANWGSPFHAVVLTRQCDTPAVYILRLKSSLTLLVTLSGESARHLWPWPREVYIFPALTSSKTADGQQLAMVWHCQRDLWYFTSVGFVWYYKTNVTFQWGWHDGIDSLRGIGENHPPSGIFIMLPPLGCNICILLYLTWRS